MRSAVLLLAAVAVAGCGPESPKSGPAHGDEHGTHKHEAPATTGHADRPHGHEHRATPATLDVRSDGDVRAGQPVALRLTIRDGSGNVVREFTDTHEAKVHLILVREGLDHFAHLHPEASGQGELSVRHTFPAGGTYHLFADFQPPGRPAATAAGRLRVGGETPPAQPLKPDVPGRVAGDGIAAHISVDGAKPGRDATIKFALAGPDGMPVTDLEPYMGAMGHLNVLSADAKQYVHAHPTDGHGGAKHEVTFAAHFPAAGLYKGWGQFKRAGIARVVPFVLQVGGAGAADARITN